MTRVLKRILATQESVSEKCLGLWGKLRGLDLALLAQDPQGRLLTLPFVSNARISLKRLRISTKNINPQSGMGPYNLAWAHYKRGNREAAIAGLKEAVRREPHFEPYRRTLTGDFF